jgi:hypothetical protein
MTYYSKNINLDKILEKIPSGLYFVGLDNHVGYFYKHKGNHYFIHSNYIKDKVMIEVAEKSECFNSNIYIFTGISKNKDLIKYWLLNKRVIVVRK